MSNSTSNKKRSYFLKNVKRWLNRHLIPKSSKVHDSTPINEGMPIEHTDTIETLTKNLNFDPNIIPEMPSEMRTQFTNIMKGAYGLGYADGEIRQRKMSRDFFQSNAEHLCNQYLFFIKGKLVSAETEANNIKNQLDEVSTELAQVQEFKNDAFARQQIYPRQYSSSLAIIYIMMAIFLLLADLPLTLTIAQHILGFTQPDKLHDITFLLFRPEGDMCGGFFLHFGRVLIGNWQVILMAVGITLCAIYFKIIYDDLMDISAGKFLTQFRLLTHRNRSKNATNEENLRDEKHVQVIYYIRIGVKFIILILTIFTIVQLYLVSTKSGAFHETPQITKWTFLLLIILLPLIAGICLSLGMMNYYNLKELNFAEKSYDKKAEKHIQSLAALIESQRQISIYNSIIEKCQNNDFVKTYTQTFYDYYLHGYDRGIISPSVGQGLDQYERALKFRDRLFTTQSSEASQMPNNKN